MIEVVSWEHAFDLLPRDSFFYFSVISFSLRYIAVSERFISSQSIIRRMLSVYSKFEVIVQCISLIHSNRLSL